MTTHRSQGGKTVKHDEIVIEREDKFGVACIRCLVEEIEDLIDVIPELIASPFLTLAPPEQQVLDLVNQERGMSGLPALVAHACLLQGARTWTVALAEGKVPCPPDPEKTRDCGGGKVICHSLPDHNMYDACRIPGVHKWVLGENCGCGQSLEEIHSKLMESPTHAGNILDPRFQFFGCGAVGDANGIICEIQAFMGPDPH
jgi:uncharacterized protein YkwD